MGVAFCLRVGMLLREATVISLASQLLRLQRISLGNALALVFILLGGGSDSLVWIATDVIIPTLERIHGFRLGIGDVGRNILGQTPFIHSEWRALWRSFIFGVSLLDGSQ